MKTLEQFDYIDKVVWHSPYNLNLSVDNKYEDSSIWSGSNCGVLKIYNQWNFIKPQGNENFTGISSISSIRNLEIFNFNGKTDDAGMISPYMNEFPNLSNLKSLNLKNDGLVNDDLQYIFSLTNLTSLNLSDNKISSLIGLEKLTNLKNLDLSNNQISALYPLENLVHLGEVYDTDENGNDVYGSLNLENNPLSDIRGTYRDENGEEHEYYNMNILANLNINKKGKLQYLYLKGCTNITENGLKVLQASDLSWKEKSGF